MTPKSSKHYITVALGEHSYPIFFAGLTEPDVKAALQAKFTPPRKVVIVSDENVAPLHEAKVRSMLESARVRVAGTIILPPGEEHKTLSAVENICKQAFALGVNRQDALLALSGGVVGDLCGFAAAIYMRGIDFVQVPTTLLAAVDSSVGGKTGADLSEGKNLVGAFHQPRMVIADASLLSTLPDQEIRNGLAEVVKYGMIMDHAFLDFLEQNTDKLNARDTETFATIIRQSCMCKSAIVAEDQFERGRRAILNYGHTVGHAVESVSRFRIAHGEGVAIGMCVAAQIARILQLCSAELPARQEALLQQLHLPCRIPYELSPREILSAMRGDKKNRDGAIRMILPLTPGEVEIVDTVADSVIREALEQSYA